MAHFPGVAWLPWLLTDDPWHLEGLQAIGVFSTIESNLYEFTYKFPGLACPPTCRSWCWGTRHHAQLAAFSPITPPSWLKPRSYWASMLEDDLKYVELHYNSDIKATRIFHCATSANSAWGTFSRVI